MTRVIDILLSLSALILLTPLLLAVCGMSLLFQGRPILYKQKRIGKDRRPFTLYKFRTMVRNADGLKRALRAKNNAAFPFFKLSNDPRVTRWGRWLRKTSVDELPQLINVLKGDMSLVGVRPVLLCEAKFLPQWRFAERPGITGPTQVLRAHTLSLREHLQQEKMYLNEHKPIQKVRIFFRTFCVIFKGK